MLCQHCQKRPATTYLSETVNGHKQEVYLCEVCAKEKQEAFWGIDDFMQGFLGQGISFAPKATRRCEGCGMSEEAFLKGGKFGCSRCARTFEGKTTEVLKRIHGRNRHLGKVPNHGHERLHRQRELSELQKKLQEAIAAEQYETAAALRDEIRNLKGGDEACGTEK